MGLLRKTGDLLIRLGIAQLTRRMLAKRMCPQSAAVERLFSITSPHPTVIPCSGTLILEDGQITGRFEVVFLLHRGVMVELMEILSDPSTPISLTLDSFEDSRLDAVASDGRQVYCPQLSAVQLTFRMSADQTQVLLHPETELRLGEPIDEEHLTSISYQVTNYFGADFDLTTGDLSISCRAYKQRSKAKTWAQQWRMPIESAKLTVDGIVARKDTHSLAEKILDLLGFLQGVPVSYARWYEQDAEGRTAEVLSDTRHVGAPRLLQEVLLTTPAQGVLEVIFPSLMRLPDGKREQLGLAMAYLIAAKTDTNIQSITISLAVVWEVLVDLVLGAPAPLSAQVEKLRDRLIADIREWRKAYPGSDPHALMGSRVAQCLESNPFLDGMRAVLAEYNLSEASLQIDLRLFKAIRDKIIHEGTAHSVMPDFHAHFDVNWHMAFAADIVILRYLGYKGRVSDRRRPGTGWKQDIDMGALEVLPEPPTE